MRSSIPTFTWLYYVSFLWNEVAIPFKWGLVSYVQTIVGPFDSMEVAIPFKWGQVSYRIIWIRLKGKYSVAIPFKWGQVSYYPYSDGVSSLWLSQSLLNEVKFPTKENLNIWWRGRTSQSLLNEVKFPTDPLFFSLIFQWVIKRALQIF